MGYKDSWREIFDVVIAKANKPEFYTSEHPFRLVHLFYHKAPAHVKCQSEIHFILITNLYYHECKSSSRLNE